MYELTVELWFSAAHRLVDYDGECERLHGHNWKVVVNVEAGKLNSLGIAVDFKHVKAETKKLIRSFDHRYLNDIPPFDNINPTAENLAKFFFTELGVLLNKDSVRVSCVTVWETDNSAASYSEEK